MAKCKALMGLAVKGLNIHAEVVCPLGDKPYMLPPVLCNKAQI